MKRMLIPPYKNWPFLKIWRPLYYGLAGFFLLAGLTSGVRYFFILAFAQISLALLALLMNLLAAWTFSFHQQISSNQVVRGDRIQLDLQINNEKPLPYPLLNIRVARPEAPEPTVLQFNLEPHSQHRFNLSLSCPYRGPYQVGMTVIDFIDCFNLVRLPFDLRRLPHYRLAELLVLPTYSTGLKQPRQPGIRQTTARLARPSDNNMEPYATVRPYQPGDSQREIHWKASLRQQTLLTRQYGQAIEPQILMILDFSAPDLPTREAWQAADALCSSACSLLYSYLSQNIPVRLISNQGPHIVESHTAQSLQDFTTLRNWLGAMPFHAPVPMPRLLMKAKNLLETPQLIYLLTTKHTSEQVAAALPHLSNLNRPDRPLQVILAQSDQPAENGTASHFRQVGLKALTIRYGQAFSEVDWL